MLLAICLSPVVSTFTATEAHASTWPNVIDRTADHVTADALPTVQIDGIVWSQGVVGTSVYAGGSFNNARPAGAAPGTNQTTRNNFLSYDITTGKLNTEFTPSLNQQVKKVVVSPDKSRVYVGGNFTTANGENRYRIAAYDTATGQLIPGFAPVLNSAVTAIAVTNDTVYAAGWFSVANGVSRTRLAAFNASNGALTQWAPTAQDDITSMVITPDGSKVVVGGKFYTLNNSPAYGMGALDAETGALLPWEANTIIRNAGDLAGIQSLTVDNDTVYGTNFNYGTGNFEGPFALNPDDGSIKWLGDCHGDTLDSFAMNGVVYSAGHAHDCSNINGFPDGNPRGNYGLMGFTKEATGLVRKNQQAGSGYGDFEGQPAPSIYYWFPKVQPGTFTPARQGGWSITGDGEYLSVGGEFPSVNRVGQQGLVRFAVPSKAPNNQGPLDQGSFFNPTVTALGSAGARISWKANEDRDDQKLTYWVVRRDKPSTPIYTKTQVAPFWDRVQMQYVDTDVTPGETYEYRVFVKDSDGNQTNSNYIPVTIPLGASLSGYGLEVLKDGAAHYWRLGDADSGNLADLAGGNDMETRFGVSDESDNAISGAGDGSAHFNGNSFGTAGTSTTEPGPNEFSAEAWFRTDSNSGGKVIGFGNSKTGTSSNYDRHIYLNNSGRVTFGVHPGAVKTVSSDDGYNDNEWHHVVGSLSSQGMKLYVDGSLVGEDSSVTSAQAYDGYWRLGGDSLGGWSNIGSSQWLNGDIDEAAVYPTALTPNQVGNHFALGTGGTPNQNPVADFTSSADGLAVAFDASSSDDPDGSIDSYAWNFGDGETGTGESPSHTYQEQGSYTVTLKVTDNDGATHTATKTVMAQVPNQGPIAAFTWDADGLEASFDGATSNDPDGTIDSYAWTFGDGETGAGATPDHTYDADGSYDVTLTVTDNDGATNSITQSLAVVGNNEAPTAAFTATANGLAVAFDGAGSADPDGSIDSYAWNFGDGETATGASADHTFAAAGSYDVSLTVTDNDGATNVITQSVTVTPATGEAPTAAFTSTVQGLAVDFDAADSDDPDGSITSYAWTFGDGSDGSGVSPRHEYAAAGDYSVKLTVTAEDGETASVTHQITTTSGTPVLASDTFTRSDSGWGSADVGGAWAPRNASALSTNGDVGRMTLSAPGMSSAAALDGVSAAELNVVGDVSINKVATGSGVFAMLDGRKVGNSNYRLKARLMAGGVMHLALSRVVNGAETTLQEVNVPSATYQADDVLRIRFVITGDDTATLAGTIWKKDSTEPDAQITRTDSTAALQGPGGIGVLGYLSGNATNAPVTLSFDNLAAWASSEAGTEPGDPGDPDPPTNEAPTAAFVPTTDGLDVSVDASDSADSDGTVEEYSWDFGDGSTGTGETTQHSFAEAGTYTVTLTVTDDAGETDEVAHQVEVTAPDDPGDPGDAVIAEDGFDRTGSGWDSADTGGDWTLKGGADFSTDGETGQMQVSPGSSGRATLADVSADDVDVTMDLAVDQVASGSGIYTSVISRQVGDSHYRMTVRLMAGGVVHLVLDKTVNGTKTIFQEVNVNGLTYSADEMLRIRYVMSGNDPTSLSGKIWPATGTEPDNPQITASDTTAELSGPGAIAIEGYASGGADGPVTISVDNINVTDPTEEP